VDALEAPTNASVKSAHGAAAASSQQSICSMERGQEDGIDEVVLHDDWMLEHEKQVDELFEKEIAAMLPPQARALSFLRSICMDMGTCRKTCHVMPCHATAMSTRLLVR
jgi:hypothetical protein